MAVHNEFPLYNGIAPSWADAICKVTGTDIELLELKDIAAINTSRSLEVGEQRGLSGGRVMKRTTGATSQEASLGLYRSGFDAFIRRLVAAAESQGHTRGNEILISLVHFDFQWLYTPPGSALIFERRLYGCRYMGDTMNTAEGIDADQVECPLSVIKIADIIDGKEVVLL